MKNPIFLLGILLGAIQISFAGESKIYPIDGPLEITCCSSNMFSVDVENINPTFAIENIYGKWIVKRAGVVVHEETFYPPEADLFPGEIGTFTFEIPMELLAADGILEVFFEFHSDFDLNPDPGESINTEIVGCGLAREEAIEFVLATSSGTADEYEASIFLLDQILKPGSEIRGTGSDTYSKIVEDFTWVSMVYDPLGRFEQPVFIGLLNSNTLEYETIQARWPPEINNVIYIPHILNDDKVYGNYAVIEEPPVPFTYESFPSMPMDSVCAILVAGDDRRDYMQDGFEHDVDLMKSYLTHVGKGPRLDESNVLVRHTKYGYNRDSLLMDIMKLKDKYKKVYFYYSGHGSELGEMCLGDDETAWIDYKTFTEELFATGAKKYCIAIDACYSGSLIDDVCSDPHISEIDVEVITSSDQLNTSATKWWTVEGTDKLFGKFTSTLFWALKDDETDKNSDGKNSLIEAFNKTKKDYGSTLEKQNPQSKDVKKFTLTEQGELLFAAGEVLYGADMGHASVILEPNILPAGTIVRSFDQVNEYILPTPSYVGWIDLNANAFFGKPVTYGFINANTSVVDLHEDNQFWPTIPSFEGYNPFNPDHIYQSGINYITGEPLNTIQVQTQTTPVFDETKIAIIVTGSHPSERFQEAIDQSAVLFRLNLLDEEYGEEFDDDNIVVYNGVQVTTIESFLESLVAEQKLKDVIFYYAGNISASGELVLGAGPNDWMDISSLAQRLSAINADEYKIFLDGSNSGIGFEIFKESGLFAGAHLDVFGSSSDNTPAYANFFVDGQMSLISTNNLFTYHLMRQYGDINAEADGKPGIAFKESFNFMFTENPSTGQGPLFERTMPWNSSGRYFQSEGSTPQTHSFPGIDVEVDLQVRSSAVDLHVIQDFIFQPHTSTSVYVFEISPIRQWKMEGTLDPDPSLRTDLIFHYNEDIDLMTGDEGLIGLVSRTSPDQEWEAYYPSEYNDVDKTITALSVTDLREWAVARIADPGSVINHISGLSSIELFPNPAIKKIDISFELTEAIDLTTRLLDLNGRVINVGESKSYFAGHNIIGMELKNALTGLYYVELAGEGGVVYLPVVVR